MSWENCYREDLRMIPAMEAAGWTPVFALCDQRRGCVTPERIPAEPVMFQRKGKVCWKGRTWDFKVCWRVADNDNGCYRRHRNHETLDAVIWAEDDYKFGQTG